MSGATARRTLAVIALAAAPTAVLAWMGCSSSSSSPAGVVRADPGGIYGAEVHVTVIGRGHVVSDFPGIDCPDPQQGGACFKSYTFTDSTQDGASGGVKLSAKVVDGSTFKFTGWKFDTTTPIGSHGRGPDQCNPIARPGVAPSVDMSAADITLPFGQANGTPPAGQESLCAPYTGVPVAYNVTATFIDTDAGFDAGPPDIYYQAASTGAAREIGVVGNKLYWKFDSGGLQGIASGSTTANPVMGGLSPTVLVSPTTISTFEVDQNLVYQTGTSLNVVTSSSISPTILSGASTCVGVASDSSNVYCKTSTGQLVQWSTFGTGPNIWYSGLPVSVGSNEMAADTSFSGYIYMIEDPGTPGNAAIRRVQKPSTFDGGPATEQDVVTLRPGAPSDLEYSSLSSRIFWIESDLSGQGAGYSASAFSFSSATSLTSAMTGLKIVAPDPSTSSYVYYGLVTTGQIIRTSTTGSSTPYICRSNINGLGGIAVDSSFIYWTAADGNVFRTSKSNCVFM